MDMGFYNVTNLDELPMDLLLLADPSEKSIESYIHNGIVYIWEEKEKIGVYVLMNTKPKTMELMNLAISEKYHGKGYGKKLLNHCINTARELGAEVLEVGTGNSSISQLAFYQKAGFRITEIEFDFFINNYEEEIYENGIKCRDMIRLSMTL